MDKYISRENLLNRLELVEMDNYGFTLGVQMGVNHAIQCVKEEPAVDVVEVKHARWIKHEGYDECEACHAKAIYGSNYCPSCGALMDKEDEHEVS